MNYSDITKKAGIILLALTLTAPAYAVNPSAAAAPADSVPTVSETSHAPLKLSIKTYEKTFETKKGLIYKTLSYDYPSASGNSEAASTFNQFYDTLRSAWIRSAKENLKQAKQDVKKLSDGDDRYYSDQVTCEITRNDENYISVLQSGYDFSLGAHGMPYRISHTFDAQTGTDIPAADLLDLDEKQLNSAICRKFLKKYDRTTGTKKFLFYENRSEVKKALEKTDFNHNFYMKNNKLYFYTDIYSAGPYAAGYIEISVTFS